MEQKARIGHYSGYYGGEGSALIEATAKEDVECMKTLIAAGANLDAQDKWPWYRPIHIAARKENYKLMDLLLDNGADIDAIHNGGNALERATQMDRIDVAKYLIGRGANVAVDIQSSNILNSVIWWYYNDRQTYVSETFKLIVDADKTVLEKSGWNGMTPYLYACYTGNQGVVDYLVEKGSNTEAMTTEGKTCSVLCREKLANGKFDGCIAITGEILNVLFIKIFWH